jgi:hypothetical protein
MVKFMKQFRISKGVLHHYLQGSLWLWRWKARTGGMSINLLLWCWLVSVQFRAWKSVEYEIRMEMRARLVVVLTSLLMLHETQRTSFVGRNMRTG